MTRFSLALLVLLPGLALAADPVAVAPSPVVTPEDTPVAIVLTGTDADGDALTFTVNVAGMRGTLSSIAPGEARIPEGVVTSIPSPTGSVTLWYYPPEDLNDNYFLNSSGGLGDFSFTVSDGANTSPAAAVSVSVTPVNDPIELIGPIPDQLVVQGTLGNFLDYYRTSFDRFFHDPDFQDNDFQALEYSVTVNGSSTPPSWFTFVENTAQIQIEEKSENATVTITATDGVNSTSDTFMIISADRPFRPISAGTSSAPNAWNDTALWEKWDPAASNGAGAWVAANAIPGSSDSVFLYGSHVTLPPGLTTINHLYFWAGTIQGAGASLTVNGHISNHSGKGAGADMRIDGLTLNHGWLPRATLRLRSCPLTILGTLATNAGFVNDAAPADSPVTIASSGVIQVVDPNSRPGFWFENVLNQGTFSSFLAADSNADFGITVDDFVNQGSITIKRKLTISRGHFQSGTVTGQTLFLDGPDNSPLDFSVIETPLAVNRLHVATQHEMRWSGVTLTIPEVIFDGSNRLVLNGWTDTGATLPERTGAGAGPTLAFGYWRATNGLDIVGNIRSEGIARFSATLGGSGTLTRFGNTWLTNSNYNSVDFASNIKIHHDASNSIITARGGRIAFNQPIVSWSNLVADTDSVQFSRTSGPYQFRGMSVTTQVERLSIAGLSTDPVPVLILETNPLSVAPRSTELQIDIALQILSQASLVISADADAQLNQPLVANEGKVSVGGRLELPTDSAPPGAGTWELGSFTEQSSGTLVAPGTGLTLGAGRFTGHGTVEGNLTINGGQLDPFNLQGLTPIMGLPALITVTGDLTMAPGTNLLFDVGADATPYDRIIVNGNASIQANVGATWNQGISPSAPQDQTVLVASSLTGPVGTFTMPPDLNGKRLSLDVTATALVLQIRDFLRRIRIETQGQATTLNVTPAGPTPVADGNGWIVDGTAPAADLGLQMIPVMPAPVSDG